MLTCMCVIEVCDIVLLTDCIAAGLDFEGDSYTGHFSANETSAVISIPIVQDRNSSEGTEYFIVYLSAHSVRSDNFTTSVGSIREATVYILDEIIISFREEEIQVEEGGDLTLTVTANAASDKDFNVTVNITSNSAHCKLNMA